MRADSGKPLYFEDYPVGVKQVVGNVSLDEAGIIEFAMKYDPQDFHIDPEKAVAGPYGGLIASGWHTAATVMRLLVDSFLDSASSLGSPGLDELRWLAPVRPGDVLSVYVTVLEARRSASKPDRGLLKTHTEAINQHGVSVMTINANSIVACRQQDGINV